MRVLFVAPHPDDECEAGGLLLRLLAEGHEVHIVYMTDGRLGSPRPEERGDALAARRRQEALRALGVLGIPQPNAAFLNFRDGELIGHVHEAAAALAGILTSLRPDLVVSPHSYELHPDHRASGLAVDEAMRASGVRAEVAYYILYRPPPHGLRSLVCRRFPSLCNRLHQYLQYLPRRRRLSPGWRPPDLTIFYVDVSDFKARKMECMRAHESQLRYMTKSYIKEHFEVDCEAYYSRGGPPQPLLRLQGKCPGPTRPSASS